MKECAICQEDAEPLKECEIGGELVCARCAKRHEDDGCPRDPDPQPPLWEQFRRDNPNRYFI